VNISVEASLEPGGKKPVPFVVVCGIDDDDDEDNNEFKSVKLNQRNTAVEILPGSVIILPTIISGGLISDDGHTYCEQVLSGGEELRLCAPRLPRLVVFLSKRNRTNRQDSRKI
jgi:hypothetical protein